MEVRRRGRWPVGRDRRRVIGLAGRLVGVMGLVGAAGLGTAAAPPAATGPGSAALLTIEGAIGPATSDYVVRSLRKARESGVSFVILRMDTPGGLDTAMRDIVGDILAAPIPVVGYVAPSGARAASAGTYILYATHVAAMAPGTNLGAATPVQIGFSPLPDEPSPAEDEKKPDAAEPTKDAKPGDGAMDTLERKAVNDAVAYIRSLAQLRNRNAEWAEAAVRESASLSAEDALAARVIDLLATSPDNLLAQVDGREVRLAEGTVRLSAAGASLVPIEPDWRNRFLAIITDPNVAYILLIIGLYGLIFEFYNPGFVLPGVVGAICLLLAMYALQTLPVDYAGVGLILLGIAFLAAEVFMPSFGALGVGGLAALVIGSVMLIDTDVPGYGIDWRVIAGLTATTAAFFLGVVAMAVKARRRPVVSGRDLLVGASGRVVDWAGAEGRVLVQGETWRATARGEVRPGQRVRVADLRGLTVLVEPQEEGE